MQLTRLSIRNFRALEAVDVVLDPATVIVGANDSGKSTLLSPLSGQPGGAGKALRLPLWGKAYPWRRAELRVKVHLRRLWTNS